MPFIGLGVGLYFARLSVNNLSSSDSEFGITPRLGAYFLVSAAILLTLTAEYNMIFTSGESTTALGIMFGAMFALR